MSTVVREAVEKAEQRARALGENLETLAHTMRDLPPGAVASGGEQRERRAFLGDLRRDTGDAQTVFERIISGNELQDVNYLARGAVVSRAVVRVVINGAGGRLIGHGTGFLVGHGVLMTNNHVLDGMQAAGYSQAEAFFERSALGEDLVPWSFALRPEKLFYTSEALDFSLVAVDLQDRTGAFALSALGWLPLIGEPGKALEGEWLTIIQHPAGRRKEVCVRENQLLKRDKDVLWYSTDTLGGSSGSPVFNNDWMVVALHHCGLPATVDGKWQTTDGRDYDPTRDSEDRIKWIGNEGIRVSRIVETLRADAKIANHPLVAPIIAPGAQEIDARLPVRYPAGQTAPDLLAAPAQLAAKSGGLHKAQPLYQQTPTVANIAPAANSTNTQQFQPGETSMAKHIAVNLLVGDDGSVSLLHGGATESAMLGLERAVVKKKKNVIDAPVDPTTDWISGYDPDFLGTGNLRVNLPTVVQTASIAPLQNAYGQTFTAVQSKTGVLKYDGYSIVMNKDRRFAFFSAANVSWDMRPGISGRTDNWLFDDRVSREHQVDNSYYKHNKFDRGHLTRREDMEWGTNSVSAVRRANGTCTWTNCTPQHEIFNQDKSPDPAVHLWQGLERYILEERAKQGEFSAQVITGPIFGSADPKYRDIAYPQEFWKVVVAIAENGELFATAYLLSQKGIIEEHGLEAAPAEPFGAYELYQQPISVIEDLTALQFTCGTPHVSLSTYDPIATSRGRMKQKRRRTGTFESFSAGGDQLTSLEEIVLY